MKWGALAGVLSALAVSSHLSAFLLPVGLAGFAAVEYGRNRRSLPSRAVIGFVLTALPLLATSVLLGWLGMRGWAGQQDWGYSVPHALLGLAYNLGWSFALLSVIGWVWAWRQGQALDRMCASVASVALISAVICPRLVAFRPDYLFVVSLAFMILASGIMAVVYGELRQEFPRPWRPEIVAMLLGTACALLPELLPGRGPAGLPSRRTVHRRTPAAGRCCRGRYAWCLGLLPGVPMESVPRPTANPSKCVESLEGLSAGSNRVWYVCRYAREEPPDWVDQWFWQHAVRMLRLKKARFDYHENILDVYLIGAKEGTSEAEGMPIPLLGQTREDASMLRPQERNRAGDPHDRRPHHPVFRQRLRRAADEQASRDAPAGRAEHRALGQLPRLPCAHGQCVGPSLHGSEGGPDLQGRHEPARRTCTC